jgi:O-antigen/teichoic acid export membrane protein
MERTAGYKKIIQNNLASIFSFVNLGFIQGSNALIQILLIPVITRIVGITEFGHIAVASSFAAMLSLFINYGSNQSGVKDVTLNKSDSKALSNCFYRIYIIRLILFIVSFSVLLLLNQYGFTNSKYFLPAMAIVFAETLNPFFFFVGLQQLFLYNICNLLAKISAAVLIIIWVNAPDKSQWVNLYLGVPSALAYLIICIYLIDKFRLYHFRQSLPYLWLYIRHNFYLMGNNLSVQLQQSFFLFTISATGDGLLLGAYSLCDKIVWSFRMLIISFSNAVYPRATQLFHNNAESWKIFKRKLNWLLFTVFTGMAVILFVFAPWIILIITGKSNMLAEVYIKSICFVPLIAALNSLNVIDLLMKNRYRYIFIISIILLAISIIFSEIIIRANNRCLYGYYPILVEAFSLPLYLFFIHKSNLNQKITPNL